MPLPFVFPFSTAGTAVPDLTSALSSGRLSSSLVRDSSSEIALHSGWFNFLYLSLFSTVALNSVCFGIVSSRRDENLAWITKRLFDNRDPGRSLYEEKSRDFDQFYRDSADEVSMQFLNAYKERFGREPPQTLAEYAFPLMGASSTRKDEVRAALDAAYSRLRAAAVEREAPSEGVFLACPRGLRKA